MLVLGLLDLDLYTNINALNVIVDYLSVLSFLLVILVDYFLPLGRLILLDLLNLLPDIRITFLLFIFNVFILHFSELFEYLFIVIDIFKHCSFLL